VPAGWLRLPVANHPNQVPVWGPVILDCFLQVPQPTTFSVVCSALPAWKSESHPGSVSGAPLPAIPGGKVQNGRSPSLVRRVPAPSTARPLLISAPIARDSGGRLVSFLGHMLCRRPRRPLLFTSRGRSAVSRAGSPPTSQSACPPTNLPTEQGRLLGGPFFHFPRSVSRALFPALYGPGRLWPSPRGLRRKRVCSSDRFLR